MNEFLALCLLAAGLIITDGLARPSLMARGRSRSWRGISVLMASGTLLLGAVLGVTGAWMPAVLLVLAVSGSVTLASNIKHRVLGEPLIFSDLALVGALVKHPHFYFSALRPWQMAAIAIGIVMLIALMTLFSTDDEAVRIQGIGIAMLAALWLWAMLRSSQWVRIAETLDLEQTVGEHGLIATLLMHWSLWSRLPDLPPCSQPLIHGEPNQLVVIVQCESFADPVALFGAQEQPLPGLAAAQPLAWRCGRLMVSGFGAYTMRTEFGALFGIAERELGLRRFDPYLSAASLTSWALPNRLDGTIWSRLFVHPHDMRFYGRDTLMPAAGFDRLIGEESFARPLASEGRYVTDAALCDALIALASAADRSSLIYAVTMENHGPWSNGSAKGGDANKAGYLRLLQHSDAMLLRLIEALPKLGRPALLCFFGDHRPSIPSASTPGGDRHTPYVIVRFDADGQPILSPDPARDLTPAELHAEIVAAIALGSNSGNGQAK